MFCEVTLSECLFFKAQLFLGRRLYNTEGRTLRACFWQSPSLSPRCTWSGVAASSPSVPLRKGRSLLAPSTSRCSSARRARWAPERHRPQMEIKRRSVGPTAQAALHVSGAVLADLLPTSTNSNWMPRTLKAPSLTEFL